MTERVIIVGAGQAGGWAACTLRDEGYSGSIVLVGGEVHPPYERPPLSKEVLLGESDPHTLTIVDEAKLNELNVVCRFGVEVVSINRAEHTITLSGGEKLPYDKLILCTGGRARQLTIDGIEHERVHVLRTLDDALRLKAALTEEVGRVLVIGGGWIGLEVAASSRRLGCDVTIVEYANRLCQRSVSPDMSDALLVLHREQGNEVLLGISVARLEQVESGLRVALSNGQTLICSHVIMAAGLVANDELAREAGLLCDNGIYVDEKCCTSDPNIYAAGDVAITEMFAVGTKARLESWQNAQDQGIAVAHSVLGHEISYKPTPFLWSHQFDQFIQIVGHVNSGVVTALRHTPNRGTLRFYLDGEQKIVGVIGMNAGREFRSARQLVGGHASISPLDLADPGLPLKDLVAKH
ncbi:NAD(P)/FAD-dependent oxidoreductase [Allopusillimonas ginsengisoli]|uniref:NAD(P)/FAD-dependent oxidoreductase n=1 Tax=Allopusillimonas ginsengisoli TaxID=453575 RepID=UPI0039C3C07A